MMRKLLLFLLLPFIGFAQEDLVKWNGPGTKAPSVNTNYTAAVAAGDLSNGSNLTVTPAQGEGFKGSPWPTSFAIDDTKYFQFTTAAKTGYKIKLNAFKFTYRGDANLYVNRYQVRYSKDNFATSTLLVDETTSPGRINKSLNLSNVTLYAGETITIRVYGYKLKPNSDPNSPLFLINLSSIENGNTTPTITGSVLPYDASDLNANDDLVSTKEKRAVSFDPLTNDTHYNGSTMTYTQPPAAHGTVTNNDNILTFTPATNFKGTSSFTYTLKKGNKTATATVSVFVEEATPRLIIWNGAVDQPKAVVTDANIIANDISASGVNLTTNSNPNYFNLTNVQTSTIKNTVNLNKYAQVSVRPKANYKLTLTQFKFIYNSPSGNEGATKYEVRYSTDPTFPDDGKILLGSTTAVQGTDTEVTLNFPANTVVTSSPNQTFYIRIYPYGVQNIYNGYFRIKHDYGGEVGPTISGIVDTSNLLTANPDLITTDSNTAIIVPILENDENYSALASITSTQPASGGSVQVNDKTNVTFTPAVGFIGTSSFVYTLYDGKNYSSATVTVTVTPPPCVPSLTAGVNSWKGYVYTYTGNTPAMTTYVGSVAEKAMFDRKTGTDVITGDTSVAPNAFCGTVPSERFYVRYLMKTTTEAGKFNFTVGGDDGYRLYIDGDLVIDNWQDQGYAVRSTLHNLKEGTHDFVLEYYEKEGASRLSIIYGIIKGDTLLPFGDNKWNVFGFNSANIALVADSYAGTYVDTSLDINTQSKWNALVSPSYYSGWEGAPMPVDQFTITYKRKGFPCGRYQLELVNCDDVGEIYIDGVKIFTQSIYTNTTSLINGGKTYPLNKTSTVEVRLREDGGEAKLALNFIDTPFVYDGSVAPQSGSSITVNKSTVLTNDLEVCTCIIAAGKTLTIAADKTLTVNENIVVNGDGKLIIKNNGSLVQTNDNATYTGAVNSFDMERISTPMADFDYTYWSSAVADKKLNVLSPNTLADKYMSFSGTNWIIENGNTIMKPGKGYIIRVPKRDTGYPNGKDYWNTSTYSQTVNFIGIPNNGIIKGESLLADKFYLVGNPYPSALDAAKFLNANTFINGTIYFWTHNTAIGVVGIHKYNSNDYASYNLTGGVATRPSQAPGRNMNTPSGKIASGESFFISTNDVGTVTFNNSMRPVGANNQFFKRDNTSKNKEAENGRMWLNMTNETGAFKQALIGYIEGATNDFENRFDGESFDGNAYIDFYSIDNGRNYVIQGRALPFTDTDIVALGYRSSIEGEFAISIEQVDGDLVNQVVYLEDKVTAKVHDLRAGKYTFTTAKGTFSDRFVLRYTNKTLGIDDFENTDSDLIVSVKNKAIKVTSEKENIKEVMVYDLSGKLLYEKNKVGATELQIANLQSANQMVLIKIVLENGHTTTKKAIFQ